MQESTASASSQGLCHLRQKALGFLKELESNGQSESIF